MNTGSSLAMLMVVSATALFAVPAAAQPFPSKVVRLVVPYPPGGSVDVVARTISQPLSRSLGQTVIVDNRPGANAVIGTEHVAAACFSRQASAVGCNVA